MDEIISIQNDTEYDAIMKAVTKYRFKQLSPKKNLTGTYWKKIVVNEDTSVSSHYYFIVEESVNKKFAFRISKRRDEVEISTLGTLDSINPTDPKNKQVSCITQEEYVKETTPLLKKYSLRWLL